MPDIFECRWRIEGTDRQRSICQECPHHGDFLTKPSKAEEGCGLTVVTQGLLELDIIRVINEATEVDLPSVFLKKSELVKGPDLIPLVRRVGDSMNQHQEVLFGGCHIGQV